MRTPIGVVDERGITDVYGTGGSVRHSGAISKDNPYYSSLMMASNNQDKDALYELAIQWEADNANLQEQRSYDRSVLEEQREYDSPLAQVQRAREAGINMDLTGGSGSGSGIGNSSAQLTPREIKDQEGQTKFKNQYDDANTWFNGINAASGFISSLTGGFTNIVNGISQIKQLPSLIKLNEANAGLAGSQANEIDSLLSGKKKAIDLDNTARYMDQIGKLQGLLKIGFKDEEASSLFNTVGIPEDQHAQLMNSIRGVHERPEILGQWHSDSLEARKARLRDKFMTEDFVSKCIDIQKQTELMQLQFEKADASLMSSIQIALSEDAEYVNDLIATEKQGAEASNIQASIAMQNAQKDMESWGKLWDEKAQMLKFAKGHLDALKNAALADGNWSEEEKANYNTAWVHYMSLRDGLSTEFNQMRGRFIEILQKRWESASLINDKGGLVNMDFIGAVQNFSNINFDDGFTALPSGGEIVRGWFNTAIYAGDVASRFVQANAIRHIHNGQQKSRTSTTESLFNSKTGQWTPQKRTTVDYTNNPNYKRP